MDESQNQPPSDVLTLGEVMDELVRAGDGDEVRVEDVAAVFGSRGFGPMILVPALLVASPLSGIPGFASVCAVIIALVSGQLALGARTPWLPRFLRRRRLDRRRLGQATAPLRRVADWVDAVLRPRLEALTRGPFGRVIAGICLLLAITMPPMEVVPMANTITGAAISCFALALVAHDGVLVLVAVAVIAGGGGLLAGGLI